MAYLVSLEFGTLDGSFRLCDYMSGIFMNPISGIWYFQEVLEIYFESEEVLNYSLSIAWSTGCVTLHRGGFSKSIGRSNDKK